MQAEAKVQEGTVRWGNDVNSWQLCRRPDTGQACPRAACKQLDVRCPFPRQRGKQRAVTAESMHVTQESPGDPQKADHVAQEGKNRAKASQKVPAR